MRYKIYYGFYREQVDLRWKFDEKQNFYYRVIPSDDLYIAPQIGYPKGYEEIDFSEFKELASQNGQWRYWLKNVRCSEIIQNAMNDEWTEYVPDPDELVTIGLQYSPIIQIISNSIANAI